MAPFSPLPATAHTRSLQSHQPFPHLFGQTLPHHSPSPKPKANKSRSHPPQILSHDRSINSDSKARSCISPPSTSISTNFLPLHIRVLKANINPHGVSYGVVMCLFIAVLWLIAAFSAAQMSLVLPSEMTLMQDMMMMEMDNGMVELDGWELKSWRRNRMSDDLQLEQQRVEGMVKSESLAEKRKMRNEVVLDVLSRMRKEHLETTRQKANSQDEVIEDESQTQPPSAVDQVQDSANTQGDGSGTDVLGSMKETRLGEPDPSTENEDLPDSPDQPSSTSSPPSPQVTLPADLVDSSTASDLGKRSPHKDVEGENMDFGL
ncbi:hypothetical protein IAR55_002390 [Kwoniella newhampshirensis]|uniref:Uncharacterized protein n=1 Tax=Kwoniella newhampshirensis TaxID=1651941 RepID=A0AAW0Z147_9TREE